MTLEARIEELADAQRETNALLRTLLAHAEGDRETLDRLKREQDILNALAPGTTLYGDCGFLFDRPSDYDLREYLPATVVRIDGAPGHFKLVAADRDGDEYEADELDWDDLARFVKYTDPDVEAKQAAERRSSLEQIYVSTRRRPVREPEKPIEERVADGWAAL